MSEKSDENVTTIDQTFVPNWMNSYPLPNITFTGHCLINEPPDYVN